MRIRIKPSMIALFAVASMCGRYYYLVDNESSLLGFRFPHMAVFFALVWGLLIWIELIKRPAIRFSYMGLMFFFPVLAVLSAFQAYRLYGQNIFTGLFAQYYTIAWAVLYYPLSKYVYYGKITSEDIKKLIKVIGTVQLIVFISQYILADVFNFTYVYKTSRYGEAKFYFSPVLLDLLILLEFDNFTKNGTKMGLLGKLSSLVYMAAILFEVMVVIKFRLTTTGLLLCLALGVLLKKNSIQKKAVYFFLAIIGGLILLNTTIVQDILNEVLRGQTYTGGQSTMSIRELGRAFYLNIFLQHPILCGGYAGTDFAAAAEYSGQSQNILLVDNGFFGVIFIYGGMGILWLVMLWTKMLRHGWFIFKESGQLAYFLYPLFFLITGIQEAHWYWEYGFMVLVLFLVIQQNEVKSCMKILNTDWETARCGVEVLPLNSSTD